MIRKSKNGKAWEVRAYDPATKKSVHVGTRPLKRAKAKADEDPALHAETLERVKEEEFRVAFEATPADAEEEEAATLVVLRAKWVEAKTHPMAEPKPWKPTTRKHNQERTVAAMTDFGTLNPDAITRATAQDWIRAHPRNADQIRALVTWAKDQGYCDTNPFERPGISKGRGRKDDPPLTEQDLERLYSGCRVLGAYADQFRGYIGFQAYVGCRPGEGLYIQPRRHLDLDAGAVWIERQFYADGSIGTPKNDRERDVVLPDPAREALRLIAPRIDQPGLFFSKTGKPLRYGTMLNMWHTVVAASGLGTDARWPKGLDPYHLRHFCGSHLAQLGVDAADIAIQLGHVDGGVLARELYIHTYEDRARERLHDAFRSRRELPPTIVKPRFRAVS